MQDGLQAVRAASENADSRNQETLEAVHETLEQIVTKLAELETAAIGQRVAQAVASPAVDMSHRCTLMAAVQHLFPTGWPTPSSLPWTPAVPAIRLLKRRTGQRSG